MDVDFVYDTHKRVHLVDISGEHVAVANFLNSVFSPARKETRDIELLITQIEQQLPSILYKEWTLSIDGDDVTIQHNSCFDQDTEHTEDTSIMDWELKSSCSTTDLTELLISWVDFIETT